MTKCQIERLTHLSPSFRNLHEERNRALWLMIHSFLRKLPPHIFVIGKSRLWLYFVTLTGNHPSHCLLLIVSLIKPVSERSCDFDEQNH